MNDIALEDEERGGLAIEIGEENMRFEVDKGLDAKLCIVGSLSLKE